MSLSPQWLDELRSRISLSSVIGRTTRLTKAGREFKACCPFHNEKTPSFTVNDEKGFYHCFGCGAHGDVIRWMTDQRGLSFMDAVKELAVEAGMEMPAPDPRAAQRAEEQKSLHDVMAAAQGFFVHELSGEHGEAARRYLASRGFPARIVEEFGFGFAPDSRTALKEAITQFPAAMLVEAGLRIAVDDKEPYDRFRNRLMLPIHDARGRVIAFGGRILDAAKTDAPKYLNSPDTPLFDKGRTLYNLHRAAPAARTKGRLVVVEGYMDVVALAAAGIAEAVAPLGTALTEHQIERLWRVVETPILCFDGDAAGKRAAMRAVVRALPMLRPCHSLRIVTLPGGMDPDDLIKAQGPAAMEQVLGGGTALLDTLWEAERDAAPLATPEDKAGLKARLLDHVETIQHADIRSLYRRDLLERFDSFAYPRRERVQRGGTQYGKQWQPPAPPMPAEARDRLRRIGKGDGFLAAVIAGVIARPSAISRHAEILARIKTADRAFAATIDALLELSERAEPLETGNLLTILAERRLRVPQPADYAGMRFGFLDPNGDGAGEELAEAIALLVERPAIEAALVEATRRFENELSDEAFAEQQRLRERKLAFEARLRQMATTRAGLE